MSVSHRTPPGTPRGRSVWRDAADATEVSGHGRHSNEPFTRRYDVAVVGAGITGLTTALLLQEAGQRVIVVEAGRVGELASGDNTGKVSVLQGATLQRLRSQHPASLVRAYVDANLDGQRWIAAFARRAGVEVQERTAYSYAATDAGLADIEREFEVARAAGLPVERVPVAAESSSDLHGGSGLPAASLAVPMPIHSAVALRRQHALDPHALVTALAREFTEHDGTIIEGVRVTGVRASSPVELTTDAGVIRADATVLATATPIIDRGLSFAKTRAVRSHLTAFRLPDAAPDALRNGLFLAVDDRSRSLRIAPDPGGGGELLIVGGGDHAVGRGPAAGGWLQELIAWTEQHFPGAELTHQWSAQDYESLDYIPFAGRMPRGRGRVWFATGYGKWGLTNGVASALRIAEEILGVPWREQREWVRVISRRFTVPSDLGRGVVEGAKVGAAMATGWIAAERHPSPAPRPAERQGTVVHRRGVPYGISTVDGRTCAVRAICPHLGGVLNWNDAEASWDCPLHGSRFEASGRRIEGPAVDDLPSEPRITGE